MIKNSTHHKIKDKKSTLDSKNKVGLFGLFRAFLQDLKPESFAAAVVAVKNVQATAVACWG